MDQSETTQPKNTPPALGPFDPARFEWQLSLDRALRWGVGIVAGFAMAYLALFGLESVEGVIGLLVLVGAWLVIVGISARTTQDLAAVTVAIELSPAEAEQRLASALRRMPLLRPVRLLLYHRLATLRHRQRRFAEVAAIAQAMLDQPAGAVASVRPHLLLMLTEARIECGDLWGAYLALSELHHTRLSLVEALQRLAVQTRYEVLIGRPDAAMHGHERKTQLAELLPAPQAGALHAMLATAARGTGDEPLAAHLWRRAELLCTAEQLGNLRSVGHGL